MLGQLAWMIRRSLSHNHFKIRPSSDGHDQLMLNAIEHENMILKYIRIHNADSTLKY